MSEVKPINTEAWMTVAGEGVDPLPDSGKTTTTVAMDFGCIRLQPDLVVYLFGTPSKARFWFLWDDLCPGALGAAILVDTRRRIEDFFAAVNYFENDSDIPFIVAVNKFDGELAHELDEVREVLALIPQVPLMTCDARDSGSAVKVCRNWCRSP